MLLCNNDTGLLYIDSWIVCTCIRQSCAEYQTCQVHRVFLSQWVWSVSSSTTPKPRRENTNWGDRGDERERERERRGLDVRQGWKLYIRVRVGWRRESPRGALLLSADGVCCWHKRNLHFIKHMPRKWNKKVACSAPDTSRVKKKEKERKSIFSFLHRHRALWYTHGGFVLSREPDGKKIQYISEVPVSFLHSGISSSPLLFLWEGASEKYAGKKKDEEPTVM